MVDIGKYIIYIANDSVTGNLTTGYEYRVIGYKEINVFPNLQILLRDDNGNESWFDYYTGLIKFAESYDIHVKYLGEDNIGLGLSNGTIYQTCGRVSDDSYYFLNDKNEYVSIRKRNYIGGAILFKEINRIEKIDNILHGEKR